MVFIPKSQKIDYEMVKIDEWLLGEIVDVQEFKDVEQIFTNDEGEKETRKVTKVRFKFSLEGYSYPHYSRKMTASLNEKSNLYKFLSQLYGDKITPDIAVNLDLLKGVKIKTMWDEKKYDDNVFQWPDKIRSNQENLPAIWMTEKSDDSSPFKEPVGDELPF